MSTVAIPAWNSLGLLPPIEADLPTSPNRSPYPVSLMDVAMRFSTSPERRAVLRGFLAYRAALHRLGLNAGFQWLNGSFMEDVETLERRPPRDIDVVTFPHTPENFTPTDDDLAALDHDTAKARFRVDGYFVELDDLPSRDLVTWSAYWYSLWSHRRNQAWKGFLQVDLDPAEDAETLAWLEQFNSTGARS
jgi:hypothetical protein